MPGSGSYIAAAGHRTRGTPRTPRPRYPRHTRAKFHWPPQLERTPRPPPAASAHARYAERPAAPQFARSGTPCDQCEPRRSRQARRRGKGTKQARPATTLPEPSSAASRGTRVPASSCDRRTAARRASTARHRRPAARSQPECQRSWAPSIVDPGASGGCHFWSSSQDMVPFCGVITSGTLSVYCQSSPACTEPSQSEAKY